MHLRMLAQQASALAEQVARTVPGVSQRETGSRLGTSILATVFETPELDSPLARRIGRTVFDNQASTRQKEFEQQYEFWYGQTHGVLADLSLARKNLTARGNSRELTSRLAKTREAAKVETRANRGARLLESLAAKELVYNKDIPELLKLRKQEQLEARLQLAEMRLLDIPEAAPGFDHLKFPNKAALRDRLSTFPDEAKILEGAIETLLGDGTDRFRQALASCRVALEGIGKQVTGTETWKDELGRVADKATRKIFRTTYELLSAYGAHPGKNPTKAQAEFGIQQTVTCIVWLLNHRNEFRRS